MWRTGKFPAGKRLYEDFISRVCFFGNLANRMLNSCVQDPGIVETDVFKCLTAGFYTVASRLKVGCA
jgi:hypothetical protein